MKYCSRSLMQFATVCGLLLSTSSALALQDTHLNDRRDHHSLVVYKDRTTVFLKECADGDLSQQTRSCRGAIKAEMSAGLFLKELSRVGGVAAYSLNDNGVERVTADIAATRQALESTVLSEAERNALEAKLTRLERIYERLGVLSQVVSHLDLDLDAVYEDIDDAYSYVLSAFGGGYQCATSCRAQVMEGPALMGHREWMLQGTGATFYQCEDNLVQRCDEQCLPPAPGQKLKGERLTDCRWVAAANYHFKPSAMQHARCNQQVDQDCDGVANADDLCPATPLNATVWVIRQFVGCAGGQAPVRAPVELPGERGGVIWGRSVVGE